MRANMATGHGMVGVVTIVITVVVIMAIMEAVEDAVIILVNILMLVWMLNLTTKKKTRTEAFSTKSVFL
jgi:hypothetical protein